MAGAKDVKGIGFQFTPLREGRRDAFDKDTKLTIFQFTPLREGRQQKCTNIRAICTRFAERSEAVLSAKSKNWRY